MLDAIAQLAQHAVRDVGRVLGDEIDPDPLGADQPHDLFDLLLQGPGRVVEQQVGLIEEEDEARLVRIPDLGQLFEQLRHQPQQEGGIQARAGHQPVGRQHIDLAAAVQPGADHVLQPQGRLAEEGLAALLLQLQQAALDRGDRGRGHIAHLAADGLGVLGHIGQQAAQVVEVQQQQALLVGDVEDHRQHPFLDVVQVQHPRQQQGSDLADRGPDRMALLPVQVPEHRRGGRRFQRQGHARGPRQQLVVRRARLADPRQIALHIGAEYGDPGVGKALGHDLQGHRLARARGSGHHAVTIDAVEQQRLAFGRMAEEQAV